MSKVLAVFIVGVMLLALAITLQLQVHIMYYFDNALGIVLGMATLLTLLIMYGRIYDYLGWGGNDKGRKLV